MYVEPVDQGPRPLGVAVAAVVESVDGVALGHEPRGDVLVAPDVLAGPVGDDDDGARVTVGEPRAPGDLQPALAGERAVAHSSAHGTTTASSCGESRATMYSAGSVSDTFSTMCVIRGGT